MTLTASKNDDQEPQTNTTTYALQRPKAASPLAPHLGMKCGVSLRYPRPSNVRYASATSSREPEQTLGSTRGRAVIKNRPTKKLRHHFFQNTHTRYQVFQRTKNKLLLSVFPINKLSSKTQISIFFSIFSAVFVGKSCAAFRRKTKNATDGNITGL